MSYLGPTLQCFFAERLVRERRASACTIGAYRDTFRLLIGFAHERTGKAPSRLDFADIDAPLIGTFLEHLERDRQNSIRTRNARLAAIHSFFRYAGFKHPEHAADIQRVLAIPSKRFERALIAFLDRRELMALLSAPDRTTWTGRRDHALLLLALQTGLRLSELTGLVIGDLDLSASPHIRAHGKGRKERITPLTRQTVSTLRIWLRERGGGPADPLFPTRTGRRLSPDAVQLLVRNHAAAAQSACSSLRGKTVTPHVLRHTCAMQMLHSGVDTTVIALWLGHESIAATQMYLHADLTLKERALARTAPVNTTPGRFRPSDTLVAFLQGL
jgi:site-specific recombinase XerD